MSEAAAVYTIRPYQPGDEVEICACVRDCYGDTYVIHKELYHPQQIARLNASGRLTSVVAVAPTGAVVGHYAIERPGLGIIGETGEAMVHPEHRHHQLFEQMRPVLVDAARRLDLVGLFGLPVTNHTFSQRMYEHFEGRPVGVNLGLSPKSFHNTADALTQRLSTLLYFQFLRRPEKTVAHVPPRHRDLVGRIYGQFGIAVEFPDVPPEEEGTEEMDVDYFPELAFGIIRVREGGPAAAAAVRRARRNLCATQGAEVVYLELPLSQPETPALCAAAEADGFFFSGVGPCFAEDGDALRLQYLAVPLDTGQLQIENPFARELLAYVEAERRRLAAAVTG
jgi:hypothetical protein